MDGLHDRRRLSLADEPADKRLSFLYEVFGPSLNMDISPLTADPVFEYDLLTLPGVVVSQGRNSPHRVTMADASRENDDLVLGWPKGQVSGRMICFGQEIEDGHPCWRGSADPFMCEMHSDVRVTNVRTQRKLIASLLPNIEDTFMRPIQLDSPAFRLLNLYLDMLRRAEAPESPECSSAIAAHICDLVALSVGATRDVAAQATRGVRAARLAALKRWVLTRLDQPGLSVASAAAAEGVSARYVQMLFEGEGTTFSAFLMSARLARAHRHLSNPLWGGMPISTIAFDSGFGDLSYFNRSFRAAYHERPTDVRHRATVDRDLPVD